MNGFLLDTNVVSEPQRPRPDPAVMGWLAEVDDGRTFLSAMTLGEVRAGITKLGADQRAAQFEATLSALRRRFGDRILPLDGDVLDRWGRLVGAALARGTMTMSFCAEASTRMCAMPVGPGTVRRCVRSTPASLSPSTTRSWKRSSPTHPTKLVRAPDRPAATA